MKLKKVFSLLLAFAMALTIAVAAGCNNDDGDTKDTDPVPLAKPVITLTDNVISWEAVEHANGYVVREGTKIVASQSSVGYTIQKTEAGSYTFTVTATSTDKKYTDSPESDPVTYTVAQQSAPPTGDVTDPVPLEKPVISISDNVIRWNAVEHADGYVVKEGTTAVSAQTGLSYTIQKTEAGSYTFTVIATSTDSKYTDSAASNSVTYTVEQQSTPPTGDVTDPVPLAKPVITLTDNIISWTAVEHADGYVVKEGTTAVSAQSGLSYTIQKSEAGSYTFTVIATSTDSKYTDSPESDPVTYTVEQQTTPPATSTKLTGKIYLVGDSTVCGFNDAYYIPRYGYGTQIHNYINCDADQIVNLALSGRSSWSFTFENNYKRLSEITAGDYLIIGFGHNDQKDDIYTNPNLATDSTETVSGVIDGETKTHYASFKRSLYENYIKVAEEKGATAILCTPIVRLNDKNDYSGNSAHVRTESDGKKNPGGDWAQAIRDLGQEKGVTVVDLTALTKADYIAKGYDEASKYHAATGAKWTDDNKTAMTPTGIDGTHTNLYGAKMNAYYIANALKSSTNSIAKHVKDDIQKPTYEKDYAAGVDADYVPPEYTPFNPSTSTASVLGKLQAEGWYTTAFGSLGGKPTTTNFGVSQLTTQDGSLSFKVEEKAAKSKITASEEGFVCAFTQLASNATFKISAEVTIDTYYSTNGQTGFGIMLRDDIYIDTNDKAILGEYAAAGVYGTPSSANILYTRVNGALSAVNTGKTLDISTIHTLSIERSGKTVTVTFDGMSKQYPDFDVCVKDADYMYICLYAIRGTSVTFNNVELKVTGTSEA